MKYDDKSLIEVVNVVEHEDGGATYTFDMTDEMSRVCGEVELKLLLYCGMLEKSPEFVFNMLGDMIHKMLEDDQANQTGSVESTKAFTQEKKANQPSPDKGFDEYGNYGENNGPLA